jgi:hypothetical protein
MNEQTNDGREPAANPSASDDLVRIVPAKPITASGYTMFTGMEVIMPNGEPLPGVTRIVLTGEPDSLWHARIDLDCVPPTVDAVAVFGVDTTAEGVTAEVTVRDFSTGALRRVDGAPGAITLLSPNERVIEAEIVAKGLTAPRVTVDEVHACIKAESYTVLPNGRTTVCQLTLDNGFTVEGYSAAVSVENFDVELGRKVSRANAVNHIWPLLGFRLRDKLAIKAERDLLRAALVGLIRADGVELGPLEANVRLLPASDDDKASMLNAIDALRKTAGG